ncbi:hypothetical protein QOT17_025029 [Balamuthia mandrillaris]
MEEQRTGSLASVDLAGIRLTPTSHTVLRPIDGTEVEDKACSLLVSVLQDLTGRIFTPVPDLLWLRNTAFHTSFESASGTQARIPLLVGNSVDVAKKLEWTELAQQVEALEETGSLVRTMGPALVLTGKRGERGVLYSVCWFLTEVLGCTLHSDGKLAMPSSSPSVLEVTQVDIQHRHIPEEKKELFDVFLSKRNVL